MVNGRMFFSGGPVPISSQGALPLLEYKTIKLPGAQGLSGKVTFIGVPGRFVVATDRHGWFSTRLPVGSYAVTGRSGQFESGKLACRGVQYTGFHVQAKVVASTLTPARVGIACNGY